MKKTLSTIMIVLTAIISLTLTTPQIEASTTNYNFNFLSNSYYTTNNGNIATDTRYHATSKIQILNNSIIVNNKDLIVAIFFWNNDTFLGYITPPNQTSYYTASNALYTFNNNVITAPTNSTHFSIQGSNNAGTYINLTSFTTFQTLTVSYSSPAPTVTTIPAEQTSQFSTLLQGYTTPGTLSPAPTEVGWYWNQGTSTPTTSSNKLLHDGSFNYYAPADVSAYARALSGLNPNTTYSARFYVIQNGQTYLGNTIQFTTQQQTEHTVPIPTHTVNVNLAATITFPAITVGNEWSITSRGWVWTDDGTTPTLQNTLSPSPFNSPVGNNNQYIINPVLDYSTTYSYRQYVTDGTNIRYSDVLTFTTPAQTFQVEFRDWDGTLIATRTVSQGEAVTDLPPNPTRVGFTFNSWQPPVTNIQGNLVTFATYDQNSYLVTFISDGQLIGSQNVLHGEFIDASNVPIPTKQGFTFTNYTLNGIVFNISTDEILFPTELIANFQEIPTFTVTWRDPAFNVLKIETVNSGMTGTPPNYDPGSGFVLVGWSPSPTNPITANSNIIAVVQAQETTSGVTPITPTDYNPISDLFGGVIGASVGAIMTLGTIDLYGIQLSTLIYLFVSMSLGLWILKTIRG
jgi:hypothetical protein